MRCADAIHLSLSKSSHKDSLHIMHLAETIAIFAINYIIVIILMME